ncbi:MAG: ABC transporter permease [Candidatus Latescibacterota bacterium]|nr:MAG: ABC transporter permease [Candidatus Latescibacterota bacterium]
MRRVLRIARREYKVAVRTKGFVIALVVAPLLMGGSTIAIILTKNRVDTRDKTLAVVDHSGVVANALVEAAERRNAESIFDEETGKKIRPAYHVEIVEPNTTDPRTQRLELSNRVRRGELHAFLEIGPEVLHPGEDQDACRIAYHSKNPVMDDMRGWLGWPVNTQLRKRRVAEAGVDESTVDDTLIWLNIQGLGLVSFDEGTGEVQDARRSNEGEAVGVPAIMSMLMFMMLMMGAMPLLHAVMEEKNHRIAEMILSTVKPFDFMLGKIIGGVGVSLTASAVYVIGGIIVIRYMDLGEYIPYHVLPWFFVYMLAAIVMMGAILAALGSACNDPKDAQSLTLPGMVPVMIPVFLLFPVIKHFSQRIQFSAPAFGLNVLPKSFRLSLPDCLRRRNVG